MATISQKNHLFAPIILAVSIFSLMFFTKPYYTNYVDASEENKKLITIQKEQQTTLDRLGKIESELQGTNASTMIERAKKLSQSFSESAIFEEIMINDFTKTEMLKPANIQLGSVQIEKGTKLPNGLYLAKIVLSIQAKNVNDIVDYLTYIVNNSKFAFTFDAITLPIDTVKSSEGEKLEQVNVTLGMYYFQ